jgi:hypothetical protein
MNLSQKSAPSAALLWYLQTNLSQKSAPSVVSGVLPQLNNAVVDFDSVDSSSAHDIVVDENAFNIAREGTIRSSATICQAKSRATQTIAEAIKSGGDCSQQALALQLALAHPKICHIAKAAMWEKEGDKVLSFHWNQIRDLVQVAASKEQQKRHVNQDRALFLESILTAVAPNSVDKNTPSMRSRSSLLGLPLSTIRHKLP